MLLNGTRLGPYEVQSHIGAGGMGDVYRGWDARLARAVALKVLPPSLTNSPSALERFRREARAIAALSHPNICTVHDVGAVRVNDGPDDTPFIVMELLEGETLEQRLARGPCDVREIIDVGVALTGALAAAHAEGIVHRDIKPANVFLTKHGPKILDFGIAKMVSPEGRDAAGAAASLATTPGVALGTVAYMSPEQVVGAELDARTDLFSLGLVLYEMATGSMAFSGPTPMSIAAAIMHDPVSSPTEKRRDLPPQLERLILKSLEKDLDTRSQTATELRADLLRVRRELDGTSPSPPVARSAWRVGIAATVAVLALTAIILVLARRDTIAWTDAAFRVRTLTTTGTADRAALSPDGAFVVYVNHDDQHESLWAAQTRAAGTVQIVPAEDGVSLLGATVTPDNSSVDVVKSRGGTSWEVWRVPSVGGTQRLLLKAAASMVGWSPDGHSLAYLQQDLANGTVSLMKADGEGKHEEVLVTRTNPKTFPLLISRNGNGVQRPSWSLDGKTITVIGVENTAAGGAGGRTKRIPVIVDVAKRTERTIPLSGPLGSIAWVDSRSMLLTYADRAGEDGGGGQQLWRLSYPGNALTRVSNDASQYLGLSVAPGRAEAVSWFRAARLGMWVGDGETYEGQELTAAALALGRSWPGATRVTWLSDRLVYPTNASGREAVVVREPNGVTKELVANATSPLATFDGKSLVYLDAKNGNLWRADADGGNATRVLSERVTALAITPDGRVIFNRVGPPETDLWVVALSGGPAARLVNGPATSPAVSPDGSLLVFAFRDDEHPAGAYAVCGLPACKTRRVLPFSTAGSPVWMPKGHVLAYPDARRMNLLAYDVDTKATTQLTHFTSATIGELSWSRDGRHLAISRAQPMVDVVLFSGRR